MTRAAVLLPVLLLTAGPAGPAGRAGSRPAISTGPAAGESRTHVIEIRDFRFEPARLEAAVGDTVVWVNRDAAPHTATAAGGAWSSGEIAPGERWSMVAAKAGRFSYTCAYHPSMRGELSVREAGVASPAGAAP